MVSSAIHQACKCMIKTNHKMRKPDLRCAFTLIELLVSMTVLSMLLLIVTSVISRVQSSWHQVSSKVSEFREVRRAFDRVVNSLSQATLNNYLIYRYPNATDPFVPPTKSLKDQPSGYLRYSELEFVCGPSSSTASPKLTGLPSDQSPGHAVFFQAPLGTTNTLRLPTALNGCGYFIQFGGDDTSRPDFLKTLGKPQTYRYRLYEYRSSTEQNRVYDKPAAASTDKWYSDFATQSRPIANNIILMVFSPQTPRVDQSTGSPTDIAPNYRYDSTPAIPVPVSGAQGSTDYQLPPLVAVTFVAIDDASAQNLAVANGSSPPLASILKSSLFTKASAYDADLASVTSQLVAKKVNFRIFTLTVPLRASKWGQGT